MENKINYLTSLDTKQYKQLTTREFCTTCNVNSRRVDTTTTQYQQLYISYSKKINNLVITKQTDVQFVAIKWFC